MELWKIVLIIAVAVPTLLFHLYIILLHFRCGKCGLKGKLEPIPPKPSHGPFGDMANRRGWYKCRRCGEEQLRTADVGTV